MDLNALAIGSLAVAVAAGVALAVTSVRMQRVSEAMRRAQGELAEQERSSSEGRRVQDVILSSMQDGVLLLDPEGRAVFANDALGRHLGATDGGSRPLPAELERAARRAAYTGAETVAEVEAGSPARWLRATVIPVGDDGTVLLVVRDVTEARRLDAIRRDFVTNASHELKTPVASILAAAETISSASVDDPGAVPRFAESLERESFRLSRIVTDLLDLSRLEGGSELQDVVRLDDLVRDEVDRFRGAALNAGIELSLAAAPVPPVRGSVRDLALLVRNLVDNAIRYTKEGGHVDVSVSTLDASVTLRVTDTGVGIPAKDLDRVFERFYRVDRARSRETGGTGLGLAIVRHIAENHGGTIDVESELGRGSAFTVRLPAAS